MGSYFYDCVAEVVNLEGGYSNDPKDPGGETNFGITKKTAMNYGYTGDMKLLTKDQAKDIYKKGYWDINSIDLIENKDLQFEIFDAGVNCGPQNPATWLQEIINALNNEQTRWVDVVVDGSIGPKTASIVNQVNRDPNYAKILFNTMNSYQTVYYVKATISNRNLERFLFGWLMNRVRFKI
jgi:lysozyme family protein